MLGLAVLLLCGGGGVEGEESSSLRAFYCNAFCVPRNDMPRVREYLDSVTVFATAVGASGTEKGHVQTLLKRNVVWIAPTRRDFSRAFATEE